MEGELATAVAALKEEDGGDVLIYGSGTLVDELTRLGLIDEYRLIVYPVLVGSGKRLFEAPNERTLELADVKTTSTGVVVATYTASSK